MIGDNLTESKWIENFNRGRHRTVGTDGIYRRFIYDGWWESSLLRLCQVVWAVTHWRWNTYGWPDNVKWFLGSYTRIHFYRWDFRTRTTQLWLWIIRKGSWWVFLLSQSSLDEMRAAGKNGRRNRTWATRPTFMFSYRIAPRQYRLLYGLTELIYVRRYPHNHLYPPIPTLAGVNLRRASDYSKWVTLRLCQSQTDLKSTESTIVYILKHILILKTTLGETFHEWLEKGWPRICKPGNKLLTRINRQPTCLPGYPILYHIDTKHERSLERPSSQ